MENRSFSFDTYQATHPKTDAVWKALCAGPLRAAIQATLKLFVEDACRFFVIHAGQVQTLSHDQRIELYYLHYISPLCSPGSLPDTKPREVFSRVLIAAITEFVDLESGRTFPGAKSRKVTLGEVHETSFGGDASGENGIRIVDAEIELLRHVWDELCQLKEVSDLEDRTAGAPVLNFPSSLDSEFCAEEFSSVCMGSFLRVLVDNILHLYDYFGDPQYVREMAEQAAREEARSGN
ncbi:hypothetical protein HYW17_04695 [Candidatus Uhrbacteria bacterium]|nr:hypothetical protein [Candidatus Uhrbacteria bacterium]